MLYPLKFEPYFKSCLWGGKRLRDVLHKRCGDDVGESWEISALEGKESVVSNGFLAGNTLNELVETYMDDLVGSVVWNKFHTEFPLLFKFIDSHDKLSVQVHPSDEMAREKYGSMGKTEMSYVMDAESDATFYLGFKEEISAEEIREHVDKGDLEDVIKGWRARRGDAFFVPAGMVHAFGKGMLIAEIQESCDVTYRLYDYNRTGKDGNKRELHVEEALEAIEESGTKMDDVSSCVIRYGQSDILAKCEQFTVRKMKVEGKQTVSYVGRGSFTVYMCVEGSGKMRMTHEKENRDKMVIVNPEKEVEVEKGECVLVPAEVDELDLIVTGDRGLEMLEVFIELQ